MLKQLAAILSLAGLALALAGCNTIEGAGGRTHLVSPAMAAAAAIAGHFVDVRRLL